MTTKPEPDNEQDVEKAPPSEGRATRRSTPRNRAQSGAKASGGAKAAASAKTSARAKAPAGAKASAGVKAGARPKATKGKAAAAKSARGGKASGQPTAEKAPEEAPKSQTMPLPRLLSRFRDEVAANLMKEFAYTSPMQVPRLSKIVLNIGLGEALENARAIENATRDMALISGQRPVTTRARKSIAGFKVREGMTLGVTVSIRGRRMYEFFDRLVSSTLPRIRDFRGVSRESFDGRGNYSLGIREQVIFPEIDYNSIDRIRGLQVVIVTTARTDREGLRLLELLGVPFARTEAGSAAA